MEARGMRLFLALEWIVLLFLTLGPTHPLPPLLATNIPVR